MSRSFSAFSRFSSPLFPGFLPPEAINNIHISVAKLTEKLEFARRAGGQVVTNVVYFRSLPDPLGVVLWYRKLEFIEFPVIANQSSDWCGNPPVRRTTSRG